MGTEKTNNSESPDPQHKREEAELQADLEQAWQDESPQTAASTQIADEVDGELGTRPQAD